MRAVPDDPGDQSVTRESDPPPMSDTQQSESQQCMMCEGEIGDDGFLLAEMVTGPDEFPDEQWLCGDCFDKLGEGP